MMKKLGFGCMALPIVLFWTASDPDQVASFQDKAIASAVWVVLGLGFIALAAAVKAVRNGRTAS
jgi:hypothetical protein